MTLLTLSDFGKRVFVGVSAETVLLVFRKKEPTDEHCITLEKRVGLTNDFCTIGTITQRRYISEIKEWNYRYIIHLPPSSVEYLKAIRTDSVALSDLCRITRGIETGDNAQFLAEAKRGPSWKPIVRGRDIDRYYLRDHIYIHYIPDQLTGPRDPEMFEQEKLVTQQNSDAPTLYYDSGNYFVLNSATLLRKKDSTLNLRVLLIILNSSLFNWLFRTVMTNWSTLTTNILPTNLGSLPIKIPSDDDFWIHLADYLLFLGSRKEHGSEIEALFNFYDRIADGLVENLYLHSHEKLPGLIQEKILPIVDMKEHQEKLDCIKTTKNKLESHAFDLVFDLH